MSIKCFHISKKYGSKTVIHDFSYTFNNTGLYVIDGESGSGKTTLLRILAGLENPTNGVIENDGKVSFSFQEYRLFSHLSALENITKIVFEKPTEEDKIRALDMLLRLGFLTDETNLYPSQLSGGMKQRVGLCRAFLYPSEVLLLDEPFKELDENCIQKVMEIIKEEAVKRTVIIVLHESEQVSELKPIVVDTLKKARQ